MRCWLSPMANDVLMETPSSLGSRYLECFLMRLHGVRFPSQEKEKSYIEAVAETGNIACRRLLSSSLALLLYPHPLHPCGEVFRLFFVTFIVCNDCFTV
ncbi:hypothetical protein DMN91_001514, partial [Ooceraea biroi]